MRADACSRLPPDATVESDSAATAADRGLVLVSTPIGNLGDISARALAALRNADMILCEDMRVTRRLLAAHGIGTRLSALHEYNEAARIPELLELLRQGKRLALVSDAGTPLLSDPGFRLVRAAIAAGLPVSGIPGANAGLLALVLSGLPPLPFLLSGFPPPRPAARRAAFARLREAERAGLAATLIWHEAPHRLAATLADLAAVFGSRPAAVARELTKRFEEVRRGTLAELAAHYAGEPARGEITLVVGRAAPEAAGVDELDARLRAALAVSGVREAAEQVSAATGLPRRVVYARALALRAAQSGE
jgi:16S rRNA (cytidine1402-2'-O)-methyltransferase